LSKADKDVDGEKNYNFKWNEKYWHKHKTTIIDWFSYNMNTLHTEKLNTNRRNKYIEANYLPMIGFLKSLNNIIYNPIQKYFS